MENTEFQPRRLPRNRTYAGYQFFACLDYEGCSAEETFVFAVLAVIDWLKKRLDLTDEIPDEIKKLPSRERFMQVHAVDFVSFSVNSGFTVDAVSIPESLHWALRLKEPDSETNDRPIVPGRFFTTDVGVCVTSDQRVEIGIRIDITDPENADEVPHAFRPKFVRYLFEEEKLTVRHTLPLCYRGAVRVENDDAYSQLRKVMDAPETMLPIVVFTETGGTSDIDFADLDFEHHFDLNLELDKPRWMAGFSTPCGPEVLRRTTDNSESGRQPLFSSGHTLNISKRKPNRGDNEPVEYAFDVDEFASHVFGYAITFAISDQYRSRIIKRVHKEYMPGEVLIIEPKRFGGAVKVYGPDKPVFGKVMRYVREFSKHKRYGFGEVLFQYELRNELWEKEANLIRESTQMEADEKIQRLNNLIAGLRMENGRQIAKIDELKSQNETEYERGVRTGRNEAKEFYEEYKKIEEMNHGLRTDNDRLRHSYEDARQYYTAAETFRNMEIMPQTNEDVVAYFQSVFGDSIVFTDKGMKTAKKSAMKPDALWYYLFHMATELVDAFRNDVADIEGEFLRLTGIDFSMGEGKQTHKDNKIMNTRMDTYKGKTILIEPHVKLNDSKTGLAHQRIYFCYDREIDRIIVGSVGEHLVTYGTHRM